MDRLEFAADLTVEGNTLTGIVHVFGTRSKSIQQGTLHRYEPSAFDRSIKAGKPIAFYAHDLSKPLGKPQLEVRDGKLYYSLDLGNQSYANDLRENIAAKTMNAMSFGVQRVKSKTVRDTDGALVNVHTVAELVDISPVAFGDFDGTSATLHALGADDRRREMARARYRVLEGVKHG